jgi:putative transposase
MARRILKELIRKGILIEPRPNYISARKRPKSRPYAGRKPIEYEAKEPGDIVQVDTMDIRLLPGVVLKQFTTRDVISSWYVINVYSRANAHTASNFLEKLQTDIPFNLKAIQVDVGSEFESVFEQECQKCQIRLCILSPRSPKLNGFAERANRTHAEEFYEIISGSFELEELRNELVRWQSIYNTIKPDQSLQYMTPLQFLQKLKQQKEEVRCH